MLAVTWPATAPDHDLIGFQDFEGGAWPGWEQVYVNQFGDARIENLVVGPAGERLNAAVYWDDWGPATATTIGPLETELAWYGPGGRLTDAGPGNASINRDVDFWDRHVISIAGRDDVAVGKVGLLIDGPVYQGMTSIAVEGGYNDAYGEVTGTIDDESDYVFYSFTAPWENVWTVTARDEGAEPTMVVFDAAGSPLGGTFLTPLASEFGNGYCYWSGKLAAGEQIFIRIDGMAAAAGQFNVSVGDLEIVGEIRVTTVADAGPGSLREAIDAANIWPDGSTIWIDPQDGDTLHLRSDLPDIRLPTTFRFAPGVTAFTIDQGLVPAEPQGGLSQWVLGGRGPIDTTDAPFTLRNVKNAGVFFSSASIIQGLTIIAAPGAGVHGIGAVSFLGTNPATAGSLIHNNVVSGFFQGIFIATLPELTITSNTIRDCRVAGIYVIGEMWGTSVTDNLVINNETGIALESARGITIGAEGAGNTLADNVQSGIYILGDGRRTGVFGNTFLRNNVGVAFDQVRGALVGGTPASQGNTIIADGNPALGQYRAGIYGVGDLTGSMALNTTIETPFLGVNLAQARGLTVANTTVRNHSGLGLVAQGQGVGMAGTVVTGLTVERTGSVPSIDTAGAVLIDATGMRLESSNFSGDTTGIFVFNEAAGLVIVGNTFTGRATGVGLFQARNLAFGQIGLGNTIQNAPGAGIYTGGNLAGTSIVANTITNNAVGIVLDNTTNLAVGGPTDRHGNAITGTGNSTGIWARLACSGTSIRKTRFSGHAADATLSASTGIDFQP